MRRSEPLRHSFWNFRAIIASSFSIQSHHSSISVFRAILVVFSVSTFRAIITTPQFNVQSRILVKRSKPLHHSFWRLEPCFASFGVQSHCPLSIRCSEPLHIVRFSVQSHIFISTFRTIICFFYYLFSVPNRGFSSTLKVLMYIFRSIHHYFPPFWLLEPLGTPFRTFWVIYFLSLTFRATVRFDVWRPYHIFLLVWHSEPFFIPIYAFWVITFLSFDVQNHCSVWHPVPPSFVSSASRAIVHIHLKTLSHHPSLFWRSESPLLDCII